MQPFFINIHGDISYCSALYTDIKIAKSQKI